MEEIIKIATEVYGSSPLATHRKRNSVYARYAIYQIMRKEGFSLQKIGDEMKKDHASVMHGLKQHSDLMDVDKHYKAMYNNFISMVPGTALFIPKNIYIAGKITGLDNYKQLFEAAELHLKQLKLNPINPTKLSHKHDKTWQSYMRECIKALMNCKYVYALSNWQDSKGAIIEVNTAISLGIKVIYQQVLTQSTATSTLS